MYKVLIADDEEIICKGIASFLEKDSELQVVALAEDGEMALDLARKTLPDLLFVDVNMPFFNGLQFIEKLEGVLKDPIIIIITGYDDFQYVQQALRLGVFDYILKPIMEDVFYTALDRAKEEMKRRGEQSRYLQWARLLLEKNWTKLTDDFLNDWLGDHLSDTEVDERINFLNINLPEQFSITIVSLDNKHNMEIGGEWNDDLLYYAAENIAQEFFQPFSPVLLCRDGGGNLIIISSCKPRETWIDTKEQLCQLLESHLPVRVTSAQSEGYGYREIPEVYERVLNKINTLSEVPQLIKDMQKYIDENFHNGDFSLQDAAMEFHVSPQYLSRMFHHAMGITFMDYVTRTRVRRAIVLLGNEEIKMYEIAELTGYSNQHYFSSAFKRVIGVSPLEYRKNEQNKLMATM
jgi:two-component system, response regulator YesN